MVDPFYQDEWVTLYHARCENVVPLIETSSVDLVLTDPPYGINYQGGGGGNLIHSKQRRKQIRVAGDDMPFDPAHLLVFRHVALFGAQHYYRRLPDGGTFHVWDKRGDYLPVHTADFDTIWINRKEPGRLFRSVWRGLCRESEHDQRIVHPTQKPVRVVAWVLAMFPGVRTIIDPYAGSGTTGMVAKMAGVRAILIEQDERYCEAAALRLSQQVMQLEVIS